MLRELSCVIFLVGASSAIVMDHFENYKGLAGMFGGTRQAPSAIQNLLRTAMTKRKPFGNPCPAPEEPFPCRKSSKCIPIKYLCDENYDCDDGYDEDPEVCTATIRPPVQELKQFLAHQKWLKPVFGNRESVKVAHAMAVSQSVEEFDSRMELTPEESDKFRKLLMAVRSNDRKSLQELGMKGSQWSEVHYVFGKLIKSGFSP